MMKTDPDTVIRVENLTAGYGDVAIIKDINFEVKAGEVFIILGRVRLRQKHALKAHDWSFAARLR